MSLTFEGNNIFYIVTIIVIIWWHDGTLELVFPRQEMSPAAELFSTVQIYMPTLSNLHGPTSCKSLAIRARGWDLLYVTLRRGRPLQI